MAKHCLSSLLLMMPVVGCAADRGGGVRSPAVQGTFYPADPKRLAQMVDDFLSRPPAHRVEGRIRALICPHAGYVYSGAVAGEGFSQIPKDVRRVVILAPSHHVGFPGGSVGAFTAYENILGKIPVDPEAAALRDKYLFFKFVPAAHKYEHSLEVMLPFLQRRLQHSFTLVPIVLGRVEDHAAMARALLPLTQDDQTLFIASSDLSHYHPYEVAVEKDRACLDTILALDADGVLRRELCGREGVCVLLHLARLVQWKPVLIDYKNSGDTAGTKSRVVGYGCVAFVAAEDKGKTEKDPDSPRAAAGKSGDSAAPPKSAGDKKEDSASGRPVESAETLLTKEEQRALLKLARATIVAELKNEDLPSLPESPSGIFKQKRGCFVTLHKHGQLRGCIGNIFPVYPLAEAVRRNALNAAFHDPRFPPVRLSEVPELEIEISVLTLPHELQFKDAEDLKRQLKPGVHGVVISQGIFRRATYLPQVWEQLPDKDTFLSYLCRKGGMDSDAWKNPRKVTVEVYEAFVFSEKDFPDLR